MCREGAWVELTVEVTSVEGDTTQTARIFFILWMELNDADKRDKIILMRNQRQGGTMDERIRVT